MKYALRMIRETGSNIITFCPIVKVPDSAKNKRTQGQGYVESLQVYDSVTEAEEAASDEKLVADITLMSREARTNIRHEDCCTLRDYGIKTAFLTKARAISSNTLNAYLNRGMLPNLRIVARVHRLRELIDKLWITQHGILRTKLRSNLICN